MTPLTQLLVVIVAAIGLTILAERRQIQAPLLLTLVGLVASFIPGLSAFELPPELILGLVMPPLLYAAAVEFSFYAFVRQLGTILNLGVVLVIVTAVASAWLLGVWYPVLSVPAAFILGAVVAPPDAVSAVAIGRQLGLPARTMTILKGESLINDAAALTLFSVAVSIAIGRHELVDRAGLYFLYAAASGIATGLILGAIVHRIRRRLGNPTLVTSLAILVPFTAYSLAEHINGSGVLAVVFAGFSLGHASADIGFAGRIQEREVWRVAGALLEAFVFAYMGLQLRHAVDESLDSGVGLEMLIKAALLLVALVIAVRIAWIIATALLARWRWRRTRRPASLRLSQAPQASPATQSLRARRRTPEPPLAWQQNAILSWSGMRGVVTIAAAAGTPLTTVAGVELPGRDALLPIAFFVAIGTLLIQGMTLPWLIRVLGPPSDLDATWRRDQLAVALQTMRRAAASTIDEVRAQVHDERDIRLAESLLRRLRRSRLVQTDGHDESGRRVRFEIAAAVLTAQRRALIDQRDAMVLDDEILREMLEQIDMEQAVIARRNETQRQPLR